MRCACWRRSGLASLLPQSCVVTGRQQAIGAAPPAHTNQGKQKMQRSNMNVCVSEQSTPTLVHGMAYLGVNFQVFLASCWVQVAQVVRTCLKLYWHSLILCQNGINVIVTFHWLYTYSAAGGRGAAICPRCRRWRGRGIACALLFFQSPSSRANTSPT